MDVEAAIVLDFHYPAASADAAGRWVTIYRDWVFTMVACTARFPADAADVVDGQRGHIAHVCDWGLA